MHPGNVGEPTLSKNPVHVYPYVVKSYHESIPEPIGNDYTEALVCHYAGAYNAAATIFRRMIQTSVLDKGADPSKKLYEQINQLRDEAKIDIRTANWAHEIRLIGNVPGAHPDQNQLLLNVTQGESKGNIEFIEEFLRSVYIMPYNAEQRKLKRQ